MSYSRPYSPYGSFGSRRGRTLNAYERARPNANSRDLYEGLNKESSGGVSKPTVAYRAPEQDIQPKDLTCLGSYNWIEATVPSIIVPGEFGSPCHTFYHPATLFGSESTELTSNQVHQGNGQTGPSR